MSEHEDSPSPPNQPKPTSPGDETFVAEGLSDPIIGRTIGNYRVVSVLGRGGFGTVYEAEDAKLGRKVALKFLSQVPDETSAHLFEREARALAALSKHSNILQIYAWDVYEGKNFFVLEYVEMSAKDLLNRFPDGLPPDLACRIVAECADAIDFAHASEILHRDIKPQNILIEDADGTAKLADFGLARICGPSDHTIEGRQIGSPLFMSPEQVRGEQLTGASDIYSLGVTLYELLCGQSAVSGDSHLQVMERVRNHELIPLAERLPSADARLIAIVDKATAADPDDRFASGADFSAALRSYIDGGESTEAATAATPSKKKFPWGTMAAVGAIGAAAIAAFALATAGGDSTSGEREEAITSTPAEDLLELPVVEPAAAIETPTTSEPVLVEPIVVEPTPVEPDPETVPEPEPTVREQVTDVLMDEAERALTDILNSGGTSQGGNPGKGNDRAKEAQKKKENKKKGGR